MWLSDEEYIYRQDIKEKKSTGRGAFHKKGGSKSKKCNFPSDYMTRKEKQALNGEVVSYNPNAWYTWEEFKALPMEYQVKYVNSLLNRYNCGLSSISEIVFGKSKGWLGIYFKKVGQMEFINHSTDRHLTRELYRNGEKLKTDMEKSRQEIQNGRVEQEEVLEEKPMTLEEQIIAAADYVHSLYEHGVPITAQRIDEIYLERCGMTVAQAKEFPNPPEKEPEVIKPTEKEPEVIKPTEKEPEVIKPTEKFTDAYSFSITMNSLDQDVINYIRDLFGDKNIVASIEVKEVKE